MASLRGAQRALERFAAKGKGVFETPEPAEAVAQAKGYVYAYTPGAVTQGPLSPFEFQLDVPGEGQPAGGRQEGTTDSHWDALPGWEALMTSDVPDLGPPVLCSAFGAGAAR